jgi:hypothetical protein
MLNPSPEAPAPSEQTTASIAISEIQVPSKSADIIIHPSAKSAIDVNTLVVPGTEKEGEGGKGATTTTAFTAFTPISPSNAEFVAALFSDLPVDATPLVTAKAGDPQLGAWHPSPASDAADVCRPELNTYFNCSSFRASEDGTIAARKETVAAYHVLVLDDVGTKVDFGLVDNVQPTWELETSPGNFQVGFRLLQPLLDVMEVEKFQRRIADAGLTDKGALGAARWARLPIGINGKPKYDVDGKPFACRLRSWNPQTSYSAGQLIEALCPVAETTAVKSGVQRVVSGPIGDGVFIPRNAENPVIQSLKDRGLYKRALSVGRHEVICPWVHEHTDAIDTGTVYFVPSDQYPTGGFRCHHSHGDQLHMIDHLGLTQAQARWRDTIRVTAGELARSVDAAERVLAEKGKYYHAGGLIVQINRDAISKDVSILPLTDASLTLALSDACDWERFDKKEGEWVRMDPPVRNVGMLFRAQTYKRLQALSGLARQPFYRKGTTDLVATPGYDVQSQCLAIFDAKRFPVPERTEAAARAALALIQDELLGEFHFAAPIDKAAAVCAIFTAVTRPSLGLAPAFHVRAPSSGTGKSYLCEAIAKFAGPGMPSKMSYPKTSEEATKSVLSTLLAAPAVLEFDDMDGDWIPHGAINRMLTSEAITDRVLGVSKTATVSTSTLVLGSGNNVGPIRDLCRRVVTINLNARSATPATLSYTGNPVADLTANRERYVTAVLTVIEAWKAAGQPKSNVPSIASYGGAWSDFCRHPLIWLGLPDPAKILIDQVQTDPDGDILQRFMEGWHLTFGDRALTLRKMLQETFDTDLNDALLDLPVVDNQGKVNRSKLGWYLKKNQDRIIGDFTIQKAESGERNSWRVVRVEAPPLPALPSSDGSVERDALSSPGRPEDIF